jgi:hypothetical protein
VTLRTPWSRALRPPDDPGLAACLIIGLFLLGFAVSVDFPGAGGGFKSDESTYYSLAHSLARDRNFTFERRDLVRVWEEFPTGPEGIFLKKGKRVEIGLRGSFPFVEWRTLEDERTDRLYYSKAYIYPLVAAPFVWAFGTTGFLVLHALLLALNLVVAYVFLSARSSRRAALAYAIVFFGASAVPVYFVWFMPEIFNVSLALYGLFLWSYKEVAARRAEIGGLPREDGAFERHMGTFLRSPASDYAAAILLGIVTFSKPLNIPLILPVLGLMALRRQWWRAVGVGSVFAAAVVSLFLINVAVTGEFNYQGGDRKTFYGATRFPFQTAEASFENTGLDRATDRVPTEVLFTRDALLEVFRHNLGYFVFGRHTGLVPYFFPGVLACILFLAGRGGRQPWQWLVLVAIVVSISGLLLYMPFTYSGGGGPVGNRYYLSFYPLFLFLLPPLASVGPAIAAMAVGGLFTAQLVINPFHASSRPAEHTKSGPYRLLPVELSLVNDLPVNVLPARVRQPLGGDPPVSAYFLDDNAYNREGDAFWVRGDSRAEFILRAPARPREDGVWESLRVRHFNVEIRSGDVPNRVVVRTRGDRREVEMAAQDLQVVSVRPSRGLPYRPVPGHPTNYVYVMSVSADDGFIPLFTSGGRDHRFLGVMVRVVPVYE